MINRGRWFYHLQINTYKFRGKGFRTIIKLIVV